MGGKTGLFLKVKLLAPDDILMWWDAEHQSYSVHRTGHFVDGTRFYVVTIFHTVWFYLQK